MRGRAPRCCADSRAGPVGLETSQLLGALIFFPFSVFRFCSGPPRRPSGGAATFIEAMRCCRDDMEVVGGILSGGWLTGLRLGRLQSDFEPACPPHACQPPSSAAALYTSKHLRAPLGGCICIAERGGGGAEQQHKSKEKISPPLVQQPSPRPVRLHSAS